MFDRLCIIHYSFHFYCLCVFVKLLFSPTCLFYFSPYSVEYAVRCVVIHMEFYSLCRWCCLILCVNLATCTQDKKGEITATSNSNSRM